MYQLLRKKISKLIFILVGLYSLLLLVACGGESNSSIPTPGFSSKPGNANAAVTSNNAGKIGPIVGADGQITVIAPPATGGNLPGLVVWVSQNNIWLGGANSQAAPLTTSSLGGKAITKVSPLAQTISPALSPDGSQVAYAYSPEPEGSPGNIVIGQDIWLYEVKTGAAKMVIKRDEPQTFLDEPSWSADGKYIFFSYRSPTRDQKGVVTGEKIGVDRFELTSGKRERLTIDARSPGPTPDGKSLVYIATDASGGTYETELKILDIATKQSKSLLGRASDFLSFYAPRPSPNGDLIVFSGVGGPGTMVPDPNAPVPGQNSGVTPTPVKSGTGNSQADTARLLQSFVSAPLILGSRPFSSTSRSANLHGLPFDLWTVKPDGTDVRRLTTLFEDQPVAAWSKNGKQVAFVAGLGLYLVDVDTKNLIKKSDKGSHGGFDWKE